MTKPAGGEGSRRDDRVFSGAFATRLSLYRHRRSRRGGCSRGPGAADRANESRRLDHCRGRAGRNRAGADRRWAEREGDLAPIADGQIVKVFWRSKPIFIFHRTNNEIAEAQKVDVASLPDPEADKDR